MNKNEEEEEKEDESLEAHTNLQGALNLFHDAAPVLHNLENSQELGQLDKLVHLTNLGQPDHLIGVAATKKKLKRNDSKYVDTKPSSQIILGYQFSIFYHYEILIRIGGIENHDDVEQEKNISDYIYSIPEDVIVWNEGYLIWSQETREQQ